MTTQQSAVLEFLFTDLELKKPNIEVQHDAHVRDYRDSLVVIKVEFRKDAKGKTKAVRLTGELDDKWQTWGKIGEWVKPQ